ncbi:hypothetical protein [Trichothermofontia sp.]
MMLCDRCQHQETCLLPQLATHDRQVKTMLDKLQACEMYLARFPVGVAWGNGVNHLRALSQPYFVGISEGMRRLLKAGFKGRVFHLITAKH